MSIPQSNVNHPETEPAPEENAAEADSVEINAAAVSVEYAEIDRPGGEGGTPG